MFFVILASLRIVGKRSISQLSLFELGLIIGLGSAAGDPMFYKDVGLLPGIMTFVVIIALYRFITFLINNNDKIEKALEGEPVYIAEDGVITYENFQKEPIAHEEFFAQLRIKHVTHLGQIKFAILETNGTVSVVFFPDEEVKWGLPILPHLCSDTFNKLSTKGKYSCVHCGNIEDVTSGIDISNCQVCQKNDWVHAINDP